MIYIYFYIIYINSKGTPFEVRFGDLAENYGAGHLPDATPSRATSAAAAAASATSSPPSSADAAASMLNRLNRQMVQVNLGTRMCRVVRLNPMIRTRWAPDVSLSI